VARGGEVEWAEKDVFSPGAAGWFLFSFYFTFSIFKFQTQNQIRTSFEFQT
jgi:hypothetical protein